VVVGLARFLLGAEESDTDARGAGARLPEKKRLSLQPEPVPRTNGRTATLPW
jgi:hypothetical protein